MHTIPWPQKILLSIHFLVTVISPLIILSIFGFPWQIESNWQSFVRFLFFFYLLPTFTIYSAIVFYRFTPKGMFSLFFYTLLLFGTIGIDFFLFQPSNFYDAFIIQSVVYIVGMCLAMFIGLFILIIFKIRSDKPSRNETFLRFLLYTIMIILASIPLIGFFQLGITLAVTNLTINPWISRITFFLNIILIAFVYFQQLHILLHEGKL